MLVDAILKVRVLQVSCRLLLRSSLLGALVLRYRVAKRRWEYRWRSYADGRTDEELVYYVLERFLAGAKHTYLTFRVLPS